PRPRNSDSTWSISLFASYGCSENARTCRDQRPRPKRMSGATRAEQLGWYRIRGHRVGTYSAAGTVAATAATANSTAYSFSGQGNYGAGSYALFSVVFVRNCAAAATEQINSQVSFSGSANDSFSGSNNGSYATNYGGVTGSGLGTTTYSGQDSVVYSGTQSVGYQAQASQTFGVYEAGGYANGSYNLGSVVLTKNANTTYTYQ